MNSLFGLAAVAVLVGAILYLFWVSAKPKAQPLRSQFAEPARYVQAQPAPIPDAVDIAMHFKQRRQIENERAAAQANLDVLYGIAKAVGPGPTAPNG